MRPFLCKFARIPNKLNVIQLPPMQYDPDSETTILANLDEKKSVIDDNEIIILTGSEITEAASDPTRDEPTDR